MSGIYISGMEMPKKPIIIQIYPDGRVRHIDGNGYRSHADAIPVPDHGRLIDESKISLAEYEQAAHDALHNGKGSILYDSGVLAGARAITRLVRRAPTIIPADKEGEG